jgi:hypothetical protein
MRRKCIAFVAALALAPVGAAQAPAAAPQAVAAKTCRSGYTHASLPWGHKCLRRGQFCKISGDRSYHRYGYHCHTGRLR